ncbi:hypothetical protein GCM10011492_27300 [Flexivirga endophytica]|uniref:Uncharacterized protein n=1 Tax=Flexivirga endophytica TaxID=1849103 RepID=A0A916WWD1_9MICO|nr:hypothetical protein [Flexivirga endophytica]GGB35176.1 hypothetical protein GCM10011492_27300 [Flexivirga endophytica]GHB42996.1 hypothetical protein GCM10008112_09680 [Flexivirga endophytica]
MRAEVALTGARAACGLTLACRQSLLDRLQGGRMLLQAGAETWARGASGLARSDTATGYTAAAAIDALHGVSMLAIAIWPSHRRQASASAAVAFLFAVGDLLVRRTDRPHRLTTVLLMEV